jgi:cytochrome c peroxidase
MKTLKSAMLVTLLASTGGCALEGAAGDEADEATEVSELDAVIARHGDDHNRLPNGVPMFDGNGVFTSVSTQGFVDLNNEFFQDLGSNGRRCVSCHVPTTGWSITPHQLQSVFDATDGGAFDDGFGLAAVFRTNDGANSPRANVSTKAKRRDAYSMLLNRGVIRVGLPVPANAEFDLVAVDDPYHYASAAELSLFRRPLPTTNLKFDSTVMWDGREVVPGATVASELLTQSSDAVTTHAQGQPLSPAQRQSIVDFETSLASAQIYDDEAKSLSAAGAEGGPKAILAQEFHIGINDNFGDPKTGAAFSPIVFDVFDAWTHADGRHAEARRAIARGQALFNTKRINITGVSGINDEAVFGKPTTLVGTCTSCHNTPNGGNHSVVAPLNIGLVDASRRTADMPLYTLRNKTTGETVKVTDPGRAMISGKWAHIGRFKGPMLRNLAPRAPYFHNGFAKNLDEVVEFYNTRFNIKLSYREKSDLVAFLRSL